MMHFPTAELLDSGCLALTLTSLGILAIPLPLLLASSTGRSTGDGVTPLFLELLLELLLEPLLEDEAFCFGGILMRFDLLRLTFKIMNYDQIVGTLFKNKHARYSNTVTPKKYYAADTSTTT